MKYARHPLLSRWPARARAILLGSLLAALSGVLCAVLCATLPALAQAQPAIKIGLTAEYGMSGSQVAQSIEKGILLAIDEINAAGGVLGRKLALEVHDDRGLPARALDNLAELAGQPEVVALFCGRFSPVALALAPAANRLGLLLLDPWAAGDGITRQTSPNFVFRLSATDTWAMESLFEHARERGLHRVALYVPNTAWGRSSEAAAQAYSKRRPGLRYHAHWYNWGDTEFAALLAETRQAGDQAIIMVSNEPEGAIIVKQMAALPAALRLPIIAHWGITGGDFAALAGAALKDVDLAVVQTFSFSGARGAKARTVAAGVKRLFGHEVATLRAQVGFAHAYDFTYLLAAAIRQAGSAERTAIRAALENLGTYEGLVRSYQRPFTATHHEALDRRQLFMARFDSDGNLKRIGRE
jgi:branched-chain amino acid transport system substrate-binding protein